MNKLKSINWNQISELGLLERINKEIMHPLGLAVFRDTADGSSGGAFVADDGVFQYAEGMQLKNFDSEKVKEMLALMAAEGSEQGGAA